MPKPTQAARDLAQTLHSPRPDLIDAALTKARADALNELATRWQFGGWSEVSLPKTANDPLGLGTAQKVTDWLRKQAHDA